MGKKLSDKEKEEKQYERKAKQYDRVKLIIIIVTAVVLVASAVIVIGNGKILEFLGIKSARGALDVFMMIMYILIILGVGFFLYILIASAIRQLIGFLKDKFGK